MKRTRQGIDYTVEDVPDTVAGIVGRRCQAIVTFSCRKADYGTLDLVELARSAYLQGFCDAFDGLTSGAQAMTSKPEPRKGKR